MGRLRIQLLLEDNTWSTQYTIPKNSQYSATSMEWTLLNLVFTVENYGIKLIYDQIDSPHADMCFSNITKTHSVYYVYLSISTHIIIHSHKFYNGIITCIIIIISKYIYFYNFKYLYFK